jgi:Family of unknown function (DUF6186)
MSWRTITMAVWVALAASTLIAEAVALFSDRFPTVGDVLSFLMRSRFGRWFLLLGWFWLGWHLFIRRGTG